MAKIAKMLFASMIKGDWFRPKAGSGTPGDLVKQFAATWSAMVLGIGPEEFPEGVEVGLVGARRGEKDGAEGRGEADQGEGDEDGEGGRGDLEL